MRVRSLVAAALVVIPSMTAAQLQLRDTTAVPRDLAMALITVNNMGMSDPTIIVGQAPDPSISSLFPRGARVLGGMTFSSRRGRGGSHTTVLAMRETPDSAINILEELFEREGLRPPPMTPGQPDRGGFMSSASGFAMAFGGTGRGISMCSDSSMITASAMPAGDQSIVRIAVNADMAGMCNRNSQAQVVFQRMEMLQLPTLRPPSGAMTRGMGAGGGSDSREAHVTLESRLSSAEMLNHFVKQLEEQGWTVGIRSDKGDLSSVTAKKTTDKNETLHLLLTDYRFDARSHQTAMRVWNPRMQMW